MKNKKASEIKWSASVKMANGGFMDKFATGGSEVVAPCRDGQIYDVKLGRCVANDVYSGIYSEQFDNDVVDKMNQNLINSIVKSVWTN